MKRANMIFILTTIILFSTLTSAGDYRFQNLTGADLMTIKGDTGFIGIGTTSPITMLHVNSSATAPTTVLTLETSGVLGRPNMAFKRWGDVTIGLLGYKDANDDFSVWNYGNNAMLFATNSAERMRIDSFGNVGIGTTSPSATLEVIGNAVISGITYGNFIKPIIASSTTIASKDAEQTTNSTSYVTAATWTSRFNGTINLYFEYHGQYIPFTNYRSFAQILKNGVQVFAPSTSSDSYVPVNLNINVELGDIILVNHHSQTSSVLSSMQNIRIQGNYTADSYIFSESDFPIV